MDNVSTNEEPRHRSEPQFQEEMLGGSLPQLLGYLVMLGFLGVQGAQVAGSDAGPWLRVAGGTLTGLSLVSVAPVLLRYRPPATYDWSTATRGQRLRRAMLRWLFWAPEIAIGAFWLALVGRDLGHQFGDPLDGVLSFLLNSIGTALLGAVGAGIGWLAVRARRSRR